MKLTSKQSLEVIVKEIEVYPLCVYITFEATTGNKTYVFSTSTEDIYSVNMYGPFVGHINSIVEIDPFGVFFESDREFLTSMMIEIIEKYKKVSVIPNRVRIETEVDEEISQNRISESELPLIENTIRHAISSGSPERIFSGLPKEVYLEMIGDDILQITYSTIGVKVNIDRITPQQAFKLAKSIRKTVNLFSGFFA